MKNLLRSAGFEGAVVGHLYSWFDQHAGEWVEVERVVQEISHYFKGVKPRLVEGFVRHYTRHGETN